MSAIDHKIKLLLRFDTSEPDDVVISKWKEMSSRVCKPCWELKYCPYGPLVEDSPLLPPLIDEARAHHEYLKECLANGVYGQGKNTQVLDTERKQYFEKMVASFDEANYVQSIPEEITDMECSVFGHICPVVFAAEGFTETSEERRVGRYLPFKMKIRVARRDNYTCQVCSKHLQDDELEFDHIIPFAKGGSSEEHNIRLTCYSCNREKGDNVEI
jgi:HNH endonuclease